LNLMKKWERFKD